MRNDKKIENTIKNVTIHGWGVVDLRNCGLTEIPKILYNYPDIVFIDISNTSCYDDESNNRITEIPDDIAKLNG